MSTHFEVDPCVFLRSVDEVPYFVAVAHETMMVNPNQGPMSADSFTKKSLEAIRRMPGHAHETAMASVAMMALSLMPDERIKAVFQNHLRLLDEEINRAGWQGTDQAGGSVVPRKRL